MDAIKRLGSLLNENAVGSKATPSNPKAFGARVAEGMKLRYPLRALS
jgi:hypothetical protein